MLVKVLLETKQEIPEYLESYVPEGAREGLVKLDFEDDSGDEVGGEKKGGVAGIEGTDAPDAAEWNAEEAAAEAVAEF